MTDEINLEAHDSVAETTKVVVTFRVVLALVFVNRAIDFDHKPGFGVEKVTDVWADWMLASKAPPRELTPTQLRPEPLLGGRCLSALIAGSLSLPDAMGCTHPFVAHTATFTRSCFLRAVELDFPSPAHGRRGRG
jgi:hypothetical protein